MNHRIAEVEEAVDDHEDRLRILERTQGDITALLSGQEVQIKHLTEIAAKPAVPFWLGCSIFMACITITLTFIDGGAGAVMKGMEMLADIVKLFK